ncbi:MAG: hypothetical protein RR205_01375 [Oscillospiraceae bacterium]
MLMQFTVFVMLIKLLVIISLSYTNGVCKGVNCEKIKDCELAYIAI